MGSAQGKIHQIERSTPARATELESVRMLVHYVDVADDGLTIRLGFQNTARGAAAGFGVLQPVDFRLTDNLSGESVTAVKISEALTTVASAEGLAPGQTTVGNVHFPKVDSVGMTLQVKHFIPLVFPLSESSVFVPLPEDEAVKVGQEIRSGDPKLGKIPFTIESLKIDQRGNVAFSVAIRDESGGDRAAMESFLAKGVDVRIIDAEGQLHSDGRLGPMLREALALGSAGWERGAALRGQIVFPIGGAGFATKRMQFKLAGYGTLLLEHDSESDRYEGTAYREAIDPVRAAEIMRSRGSHQVVKRQVERLEALLENGSNEDYLKGFAPDLVEAQRDLLRRKPAFVRELRLSVPGMQRISVKEDGSLANVAIRFSYAVESLPEDNRLFSLVSMDFEPPATGTDWRISRFQFQNTLPFWLLGFTRTYASEHFLIIYRGLSGKTEVAALAGELEEAYDALEAAGLPVERQNLAVLVRDSRRFKEIAGVTPPFFDGAIVPAYSFDGKAITVENRMMLVNEANLDLRRRAWNDRTEEGRRRILRHDYVHLVLARHTRPYTPGWVVEGAAVHFSGQVTPLVRRALLTPQVLEELSLQELSSAHTLGVGEERLKRIREEYAYSGEAVSELLRAKGNKAFVEFYQSFGSVELPELRAFVAQGDRDTAREAGLLQGLTETLLEKHFGLGMDDLDGKVKAAVGKAGGEAR